MKTLVPMAVTCSVHADVSKGNSICGVPGHPDGPACSLLPVLRVPLAFMLHRHIPEAAFGGGWRSFMWTLRTSVQCPGKNGISRTWKLLFLQLGCYTVTKLGFPESSGETPTGLLSQGLLLPKSSVLSVLGSRADALGQC